MIDRIPDISGADVTVMGLGLHGGGAGVTRFLVEQGANVTVTDLKSQEELQESLSELEDLDVDYVLGEHRERDFSRADFVIVNPAVPLDSPFLEVAEEHGTDLESELNLFVKFCPAKVIGITGSAGKSTTTAMTGDILQQSSRYDVHVGGNIGGTLLNKLDKIAADDIVVLEISSFQLLHLDRIHWSPFISIVTNIFPNHLDRHGTLENYAQAKKTIIQYQGNDSLAILNAENDILKSWTDDVPGDQWTFSVKRSVTQGAWVDDQEIYVREHETASPQEVLNVEDVPVPGTFNLENVLASILAAKRLSVSDRAIKEGIRTFEPLPHHLEQIVEVNGVKFVDDSVSTTPDSTIAAIQALDRRRTVVILGGYDKGVSLEELVFEVKKHADGAVLIGETADRLKELFESQFPSFPFHVEQDLPKAVQHAYERLTEQGGVVLLSTASASYDMFQNYQERGRVFREKAHQLNEQFSG